MRLKAILGAGGTGKSFKINELTKENNFFAYRTATTGIAAVNMGTVVGAQAPTTINSALRFFDAESLLRSYHKGNIYQPLKVIASKFQNIVIDEVSMMNAGVLDILVLSIETFNQQFDKDLGLILCGDPGQLPAVQGKPFFLAKCWPRFEIEFLTEVKRQKDEDFIRALNLIRQGKAEEAAPWFEENIEFTDKVNDRFRGTTFFPTNNEVDNFNRRCLNKLRGEPKTYRANLTGKKDPSWKNAPMSVELKVGCIIQLLYNNFEAGFSNGDSAIVEEMWDNSIYISLLRINKQLFLRKTKLQYFTFNSNGYRKTKPEGELELLYVRLAYALTIHKAQGLTLDAVQLNLKGMGTKFLSKQSGMLYTALSRVRTPKGLTIVGTIDDLIKCCYVDKTYLPWIR